MFESQKHTFWQALLITIVIFSMGIIFGVVLENWRTNKVDNLYKYSEIDLLDVKLQSEIYSMGNFNCGKAVEKNIAFADRVYEEAKQLEEYEKSSILTQDLKISHKKYDILRTILLLNSNKIKEQCNVSYQEVVYFYRYNNVDLNLKEEERVFSRLLEELKNDKGDKVLLIPIAADNNITSVDLILDKYNILQKDLPVILIDGKIKISELKSIDDLKKYFSN